MSLREAMATISACLEDASVGLTAKADALAAAAGYDLGHIRTDFVFGPWLGTNNLQPIAQPKVSLLPMSGGAEQKAFPGVPRQGAHRLRLLYRWTNHDAGRLADNAVLVVEAALQVLDGIEAFSRAQTPQGPIERLDDPLTWEFLEFESASLNLGFALDFTVHERSTV